MGKKQKLLEKLTRGTIDADELRTLLHQCSWIHQHTTGSHEHWSKDSLTFILATHGQRLLPYQIKQAKKSLSQGGEDV